MPRDLQALVADAGVNLLQKSNYQIDKAEHGESYSSIKVNSMQDNKSSDAVAQVMEKDDLVKSLERSKKRNASALGTPKVNEKRNLHSKLL